MAGHGSRGGSAAMGTGAPAIPSLPSALPRICSLLPGADITLLSLLAPNVYGIWEVLATGPCPSYPGFCLVILSTQTCSMRETPSPSHFWGATSPPVPLCPGIPPPQDPHEAPRVTVPKQLSQNLSLLHPLQCRAEPPAGLNPVPRLEELDLRR